MPGERSRAKRDFCDARAPLASCEADVAAALEVGYGAGEKVGRDHAVGVDHGEIGAVWL